MNDDNLRNAARRYFSERDHDLNEAELARLADARRMVVSTPHVPKTRFAVPLVLASVVSLFTVSAIWTTSFKDFSADELSASVEIQETIIDSDIDPEVLADYEFYQWISEQELDAG